MSTLYVCATPIGNLSDVSPNLLDTLKKVDLVVAEDTRQIQKILNKFEIKTRTTSYHKFNLKEKTQAIIDLLKNGSEVALVSDGGTPCISDPGFELVAAAHSHKIAVYAIAGPCAAVAALSVSGIDARHFCFEGFLPKDRGARRERLKCLARDGRPTILYEAPHRLLKTLEEMLSVLGDQKIFVARELTKKFEENIFGFTSEIAAHYKTTKPRGEFVIIIGQPGAAKKNTSIEREMYAPELSGQLNILLDVLKKNNLPKKQISKIAARVFGVSANEIYTHLIKC